MTQPFPDEMTEEDIRQSLKDAGCTAEFIQRYMHLWERGTPQDRARLLDHQRRELLDGIHTEQKKLDCLDYLRYRLQKQEGK